MVPNDGGSSADLSPFIASFACHHRIIRKFQVMEIRM